MTTSTLPIGFSSIGLPGLSPEKIFSVASKTGVNFVEMRVMDDGAELRRYIETVGKPPVPIRIIGTSLNLADMEGADFANFFKVAHLADRCGSPWIRVFSGGEWTGKLPPQSWFDAAAAAAERCRQIREEHGFSADILLETHSALCSSEGCLRLAEMLEVPISILWDSHHTWRLAGESLTDSWAQLGPLVRHVHCKDSLPDATHGLGYRYVPSGEGAFPMPELLEILDHAGYREGLSLEWEKMWHPDIADFQEAYPAFVKAIGR